MKPRLKWLDDDLVARILAEARTVLWEVGVTVEDANAVALLADAGASVETRTSHVKLPPDLVQRAMTAAPETFDLFDVRGKRTHAFGSGRTHFAPASAALTMLDSTSQQVRKPTTVDYVAYTKVVAGLERIDAQSTAMIPSDVHQDISDSYRLFLALLYCEKPVVTGVFWAESFEVMHALQVAVRGSQQALEEKPLSLFTCCPSSPLRWNDVSAQNLLDCARALVPVEIVPVPMTGFTAPVSLVGTLVQHCAEVLSGITLGQLARHGCPMLFGGCPAIFDVREETTPMGAVETMMLAAAGAELGQAIGVPTQGFVALSDAKVLDAQAGLETSMGATLAGLSGLDQVAGPGMLDFIGCFSLDKLVLDHEICKMVDRMTAGIEPRDDFPAVPLLRELIAEKHLLIADHTRKHLRSEITFPGQVIDRTGRERWVEDGAATLAERTRREIARLTENHAPSRLPRETAADLERLMLAEARRVGMDRLPERPT